MTNDPRDRMHTDPRDRMHTDRDLIDGDRVVVERDSGPRGGGVLAAAVLLVLAVLLAVWLFNGAGDDGDAASAPTETTTFEVPSQTTPPAGANTETTLSP